MDYDTPTRPASLSSLYRDRDDTYMYISIPIPIPIEKVGDSYIHTHT